jgi:ethanolamine-phosphate cytidylyltransferase
MSNKVLLNPDEPTDEYQMYATTAVPVKKPGTVRIWVDGCFDMLHFGHTNAIRQAAILGHELFVGCHSDEEIIRFKGPPIMHAEERYEALRACKWVTFVVENYPYCTRLKDMERFQVDFVAHGDDISVDLNGRNSYQEIIDAGRFKVVKRTDGISTTDLVGRMLLCTKSHMLSDPEQVKVSDEASGDTAVRYMTTTSKLCQFSNNRPPKSTDKIVYVDGSFDLFHIGHMRILEAARKLGSYVIAGVHEDKVINDKKGKNYPIMNLNERVLGVLSCKYVDEVVMGVPFQVTKDIIESLKVSVVVAGVLADDRLDSDAEGTSPVSVKPLRDPYAIPRAMGILVQVDSNCSLTTDSLIERVLLNRQAFLERQASKKKKDKRSEEMKPEEYKNVQEVS